jgi:hypothetical protein
VDISNPAYGASLKSVFVNANVHDFTSVSFRGAGEKHSASTELEEKQIESVGRGRRSHLNNPPTAVGGIMSPERLSGRLDLKHPPTAVGGIMAPVGQSHRLDLNDPPTAVGGIYHRRRFRG